VPVTWSNWARQQRCAPEALERPRSEGEVVATVRRARERGLVARAVGAGHSFTDIACTDGVMLDMSAMDRVLDHDATSGLVRVQAGISINALGRALEQRGLALENQGDIDRQTLAGAAATATHGTGVRFANLSAGIQAVRLVTAVGEPVEVSHESDPETLLACRVGLGALGVITELTLRAVPLFTLRRVDEPRPLRDTLERVDELVDRSDHFELWVFPYSDVALTRTCERIERPPPPSDERSLWFQEVVLENALLEAVCRVGRAAPPLVARLNRAIPRLASRSTKQGPSWRVYASRRSVRFTEMEYAIPREHGREALERVLELVQRRRLAVNFPVEFRFAAGDDAFLSTAHGRASCYIAVHQFHGMEYETYFRAVERIMDDYDGRPHWGKRHYQTAATLAPRYPAWERFQAVRARLDPDGLFANDYTRRVLGPARAPVAA
jgi:L-gulono-1,4-lactone dehydrogenase